MLNMLRNPYGVSADDMRNARHEAAETIEHMQRQLGRVPEARLAAENKRLRKMINGARKCLAMDEPD